MSIQDEKKRWESTTLKKVLDKRPERRQDFRTTSGIEMERVFTPSGEAPEHAEKLGLPGEFPFTRGVQPTMYRGQFWTMRQYAGFGTARESNERYRYLLGQGQTGLSVAFDLPTQMGYDSDSAMAEGEVGKVGVAIDSLADMEIIAGRIERIELSLKKPLPRQEHLQLEHELATLRAVLAAIESGRPLREAHMTEEQQKVTRSFRLLSEKPRLVVVNTADDERRPERFTDLSTEEVPVLAAPVGLELELARLSPEDRAEFEREMGAGGADRDAILRRLLDISGQITFFTCGDREVRTWVLPRGGTALEAAENIHTDLARGFIRAEVIQVDDLLRLGGEREVMAHGLMRQEPKDYVILDDDIVFIRFSV